MRILHLADTHLGIENYGRIDAKTGVHTRLLDFLKCLDYAVDYALSEGADLVLFAGDAFKNRDPSETQQNAFARRIKKLADAGIAVFLLVGNHDLPAAEGRATALDIYHTLGIPGVTVGREVKVYPVQTRSGPVQVAALPHLSRNALLKREEFRGKKLEEMELELGRLLAGYAEYLAAGLDPGAPALLTAHLSVDGAVVGSERSIMLGGEVSLPPGVFRRPEFAYVALGHIHRQQILAEDPPLVYSGSIERVDFSEEKEPKGFMWVELEGKKARYRFVSVPARPFITRRVRVQGAEPTAEVLAALEEDGLEGAVVRLILEGEVGLVSQVDLTAVRRLLEKKAFYVAGIQKEVSYQAALRNPGITEATDPLAALKDYLATAKTAFKPEELLSRAEILYRRLKEGEEGKGCSG
ncbi:MAG: repair protein SbcD/Mre11 [Clostridia bacterium]|nr:repair protein SbcD/Mre11 [Clostridia bacterium]